MNRKPTKIAKKIFHIGLPAVLTALIWCAFSISVMEPYDAARLSMRTYAMLEHLFMSLTLITGGGLLFDLYERRHS
ncbi:MAG: hypothetical protein E7632_00770 [Ruminococcaceae bacterium]|nr:hypothetical protein [Oscillospiraceae bacterium]